MLGWHWLGSTQPRFLEPLAGHTVAETVLPAPPMAEPLRRAEIFNIGIGTRASTVVTRAHDIQVLDTALPELCAKYPEVVTEFLKQRRKPGSDSGLCHSYMRVLRTLAELGRHLGRHLDSRGPASSTFPASELARSPQPYGGAHKLGAATRSFPEQQLAIIPTGEAQRQARCPDPCTPECQLPGHRWPLRADAVRHITDA